jgi:hypothetical protein
MMTSSSFICNVSGNWKAILCYSSPDILTVSSVALKIPLLGLQNVLQLAYSPINKICFSSSFMHCSVTWDFCGMAQIFVSSACLITINLKLAL